MLIYYIAFISLLDFYSTVSAFMCMVCLMMFFFLISSLYMKLLQQTQIEKTIQCRNVQQCKRHLHTNNIIASANQLNFIGCPPEITAITLSFNFALPHIPTLNSLFDIGRFVIVVGRSTIPQINCGLIFERQLQSIGKGGMYFFELPHGLFIYFLSVSVSTRK